MRRRGAAPRRALGRSPVPTPRGRARRQLPCSRTSGSSTRRDHATRCVTDGPPGHRRGARGVPAASMPPFAAPTRAGRPRRRREHREPRRPGRRRARARPAPSATRARSTAARCARRGPVVLAFLDRSARPLRRRSSTRCSGSRRSFRGVRLRGRRDPRRPRRAAQARARARLDASRSRRTATARSPTSTASPVCPTIDVRQRGGACAARRRSASDAAADARERADDARRRASG